MYIWTDCDREGEHIGSEIKDVAIKAKPNLEVKRAKFSNIERACVVLVAVGYELLLIWSSHIIHAAKHPIELDQRQANAVAARIELDLRIGASFTRMQTFALKPLIATIQELKVISYGTQKYCVSGKINLTNA